MIIKITIGDQVVGEKPVKDYKSAVYYLLEQIIEHKILDWSFCESENLDDWNACFGGEAETETARLAKREIESGNSVLWLTFESENNGETTEKIVESSNEKKEEVLFSFSPQEEKSQWRNVFEQLASRFNDEQKRVELG